MVFIGSELGIRIHTRNVVYTMADGKTYIRAINIKLRYLNVTGHPKDSPSSSYGDAIITFGPAHTMITKIRIPCNQREITTTVGRYGSSVRRILITLR